MYPINSLPPPPPAPITRIQTAIKTPATRHATQQSISLRVPRTTSCYAPPGVYIKPEGKKCTAAAAPRTTPHKRVKPNTETLTVYIYKYLYRYITKRFVNFLALVACCALRSYKTALRLLHTHTHKRARAQTVVAPEKIKQ